MPTVSRRQTLTGAAAGLGIPVLAACGDDGGTTGGDAPADPTSSPTSASSSAGAKPSTKAPTTGLVATADVPVGGGVVLPDEEVVVTQPVAGEFKAFSSTCTHMGCAVGSVDGEQIICPCHDSRFSITDGSVLSGPASASLGETPVRVADGQVVAG